jgi:hypothetical protein
VALGAFEAELGEDCLRVGAQDVIRRLAGVDCEQAAIRPRTIWASLSP